MNQLLNDAIEPIWLGSIILFISVLFELTANLFDGGFLWSVYDRLALVSKIIGGVILLFGLLITAITVVYLVLQFILGVI